MYDVIGELPRHLYVWIDSRFTHREPIGFVPAVWFGLVSLSGRVWGCTVLLDSGAVYRALPPMALAFRLGAADAWTERDAQHWDCYGTGFSVLEYRYLAGLAVTARVGDRELPGHYLFSVAPVGDGFSAVPEQAKEFSFIALENGRLTIQPTNHLLVHEASFTKVQGFPTDLKRQTEIWSCE